MIDTDGVIYVLKRKVGSRDYWTRMANAQTEFERYGGTLIEQPIVEESPTSRRSMLELLARCSRRRQQDPLIAVSTWKEVANLDVARALIKGGFTVVVADEARKFRLANTEKPNAVYLLEHVLEINRKLRAYVDAKETGSSGVVNELRAGAAKEFALNIWPAIKNAAEESETTNQTKIAAILDSQGLKSTKGSTIRQAHIARYIKGAGKEADWKELRRQFPKK